MEVLEHVADVDSFLSAAATLVRPGGLFVGATLNRTLKSYALAIVGAEYLLRWVEPGTHDWNKFLTSGRNRGSAGEGRACRKSTAREWFTIPCSTTGGCRATRMSIT